MTKLEQIQTQFKGVSGCIDIYTANGDERFNFIDVDQDRLDGIKSFVLSCGCCSDYDNVSNELSYELKYMDESDFQELIEQLEKLKTGLAL
jgi:hypothetical protein